MENYDVSKLAEQIAQPPDMDAIKKEFDNIRKLKKLFYQQAKATYEIGILCEGNKDLLEEENYFDYIKDLTSTKDEIIDRFYSIMGAISLHSSFETKKRLQKKINKTREELDSVISDCVYLGNDYKN